MQLDLTENIVPKFSGILTIHEIHDNGNIKIHNTPNVITYDARTILSQLMSGDNSANKYIKYLNAGTDNTAPTRNDTALANQVDSSLVTFTLPAVDRIVFEGILPNSSPSNGQTLREAGLFNEDGQMFARQVYGDIAKTSAIQLKYIWTIIFT